MSSEELYEKLLKLRHKETENGRRSFIVTPVGLVDTAGLPATSPTYFEGCTEDEIQEVMNAQGVTFLPDNYQRFLRIMGKGSGYPFAFPESWQYSTLFTIKQSGQWLLDFVKSGLVLPHDTFVFYFDQTMYFCFFLTGDQVEDPQVYQFTDDFSGNGFILIHEHLSEWFYKEYTKVSAHYDFSTLT